MYLSIEMSTMRRVVVHCMQSKLDNHGAPLLELSLYPFSKYLKFVADVLATSLLQKSRSREIPKNECRQTKPGSDKTNAHCTAHLRCAVKSTVNTCTVLYVGSACENVPIWKLSKLNVAIALSIFDLWKGAHGSCVPR